MKAYAGILEKIAENLGLYHDIEVMQDFISKSAVIPDPVIQETLQEACGAKKTMLLYDLWPLADMAYSEDPRAMVDRLANYWRIYFRSNPEPLNHFHDEK
jgi:hypothetical protein